MPAYLNIARMLQPRLQARMGSTSRSSRSESIAPRIAYSGGVICTDMCKWRPIPPLVHELRMGPVANLPLQHGGYSTHSRVR